MTRTSLRAPRLTWRARVQAGFAMVLAATLATGAAGCSSEDSSTAPTNVNPTGEYSLETIQAKPLPAKVYDGPIGNPRDDDYYQSYVVTVTGGTLVLDEDGYYHILVGYNTVADDEPFFRIYLETGSYEVDGSRIVLTNDYGESETGTVRDGEVTIKMAIGGEPVMPYVFRK